jgi:protein phosphatase
VKLILRSLEQLFSNSSEKEKPKKRAKKSVASDLPAYNLRGNANDTAEKISDAPEAVFGNASMIVRSFGITDVGLKRSHNEDNFYRSDELGIYLVADGMGGHAAGEVASNTAIQSIAEFAERFAKDRSLTWPFGFDNRLSEEGNALITGIQLANQTLCKMQQQQTELTGMGTTLAALRITGDQALIAHVGDSRVYRLRGDSFELLTSDHSWVNEQLQKNIITAEEARTHRYRNVIRGR